MTSASDLRRAVLVLVAVALLAALGRDRPPAVLEGAPPRPPEIVDLNRATAAELEALPGIGPERARRIVRQRRARGGYRSVDELLDVPGVGPRTVEALRPRVRVAPGG